MVNVALLRESMHPKHALSYLRYQISFAQLHPDYFEPDGLVVFCGGQGTGKTMSAVNYVYRLMETYPGCKLVTNIELRHYPILTFDQFCIDNFVGYEDDKVAFYPWYLQSNRVFEFRDNDDFARYDNGEFGVIFLVDEIQLYLNSLESKNINLEVITQVSQQRKQRKHIVCTSQVFGRMAKPLREQFSCVIACKRYLECVQCNRLIDRDSLDTEESTGTNISGEVLKKFFWIRTPEMFGRYDTYRVIERGKFVSAENKLDIYGADKKIEKEGDKKK